MLCLFQGPATGTILAVDAWSAKETCFSLIPGQSIAEQVITSGLSGMIGYSAVRCSAVQCSALQ